MRVAAQEAVRGRLGGSDGVLLGTHAKSAVASPAVGSLEALQRRYELQSVARVALPRERVWHCLRHVVDRSRGVDVWHSPELMRGSFTGLQTCGSVWACPPCAAKIAERRREELEAAIAAARGKGYGVLVAAYTFRHGPLDGLNSTLGRFLDALRYMAGTRAYRRLMGRYGLLGSIKALEVTHGTRNGWHPHAHVLYFLDRPLADEELADLQAALYALWELAAARGDLDMDPAHGLRLQSTWGAVADYVTKWGHEPKRRPWGAADELTKATTKQSRRGCTPWGLLRWAADTGEAEPLRLFREYHAAFKGRRQLVWSRHLADLLGLKSQRTDEELAEETTTVAHVHLANLTHRHWLAVTHYDRHEHTRAHLQHLAASPDPAPVRQFADHLLTRYETHDTPRPTPTTHEEYAHVYEENQDYQSAGPQPPPPRPPRPTPPHLGYLPPPDRGDRQPPLPLWGRRSFPARPLRGP